MITTLMMLLGLSGAGAGLYNVLKSPSSGSGGSEGGGNNRRRRRNRKDSEEPFEGGGEDPSLPPPKWGGRGKEVPFQTPHSASKGAEPNLPEGGLPALEDWASRDDEGLPMPGSGGGGGGGTTPGGSGGVPSKNPRGRNRGGGAGKQNQQLPQSLEDIPLGDFGDEEDDDFSSPDLPVQNLRPKKEKPEVSFSVDDIISKNSKYSFHRRPLLNAEALMEKNNVEEAIEIFLRTGERIPDQEIKNKIQKNIQDLEEYMEDQGSGSAYEPEKDLPGKQSDSNVTDPKRQKRKIDGASASGDDPSSQGSKDLNDAGLQDFVSAMKQVSEIFAESIAKAIQYAGSGGGAGGATSPLPENFSPPSGGLPSAPPGRFPSQGGSFPPPSYPIPPSDSGVQAAQETPQRPEQAEIKNFDSPGGSGTPGSYPSSLPPPGAVGADFLHPLIYQFLKDAPPIPGYSGADGKAQKENYENLLKSLNQGLMAPPTGAPTFMPPMQGGGASGIVGPFYLPNPEQIQADLQGLSDALNQAASGAAALGQATEAVQSKDVSELDLPEDTFFSTEWKQFRDLPLVDRRSGKERRVSPDRRENKAGRKDRRSGVDRRKGDRFKERENYLKDKALQKLESDAKKAQKITPSSLNDLLRPYFPALPQRLDLPEGLNLKQDKEEEPPKEEEWISSDEDSEWFDKTNDALKKEVHLPSPSETEETPITAAPKIGLPDAIDPAKAKSETVIETDEPIQVELMGRSQPEEIKIGLPDADEVYRDRKVKEEEEDILAPEEPELDTEPPEIEIVDGNLGEIPEAPDTPEEMANKVEEEPEKIIHGVLELKPPEADDAPFLTLTYDFGKIPHAFRLSKNYSIMEYSYFKYKPMLMKAQEFARRKMLKNALNYYRVIKSQNIPPELRKMINRNIRDITEFMEKFLMAKGG
ncbi:hypothetical protein [Leptospira idonii]|uniref:Uncharacterized protein n=1 Tax=Leptospira idonii TaxID=1193500 RepID=A0A4R9M2Y1_9LEPT|nr:hypothetical protein [Leptospira idonii]TGN20107.1 hypothetical protein EHS15_05260 [Leptospira idonii]